MQDCPVFSGLFAYSGPCFLAIRFAPEIALIGNSTVAVPPTLKWTRFSPFRKPSCRRLARDGLFCYHHPRYEPCNYSLHDL